MYIENIMDMGAQAKNKKELAPFKKTEHSAFQMDMQRAVKRAGQPVAAAPDAQASEPSTLTLKNDDLKTQAYKDIRLVEHLQQDKQEADDAVLGTLLAYALPVAAAPINEEIEKAEAAPTEQAQAIPALGHDSAMPPTAPLQEENTLAQAALTEEPAQKSEPMQDASSAAYIRGEIQAVVSNEAERTVHAHTQDLKAQEAPEHEAAGSFVTEDEMMPERRVYDQNKMESPKPQQEKGRTQGAQSFHTAAAAQVFHGAHDIDASALSDENAAIPREAQESFFSDLLDRVEVAAGEKEKELFVQLKPETLGGLSIRLIMNEEGMHAQVKTASRHLQAMMHAELNHLTHTLRERGVEIVHMELIYDPMYGGDQKNGQDGAYHQADGGGKTRLRKIYAADAQAPLEQLYETMIPIDIADAGAVEYQA